MAEMPPCLDPWVRPAIAWQPDVVRRDPSTTWGRTREGREGTALVPTDRGCDNGWPWRAVLLCLGATGRQLQPRGTVRSWPAPEHESSQRH